MKCTVKTMALGRMIPLLTSAREPAMMRHGAFLSQSFVEFPARRRPSVLQYFAEIDSESAKHVVR